MHHTEIAAFLNQKGGVGKTTSVVNIAAGLAILGKEVLIVDLDPQGHLTSFLGIDHDEIGTTIYDVMRGADPRDAMIRKSLGAKLSINGQDSRLAITVIPSDLEFSEAEMTLSLLPNRETLLRRALQSVVTDYDYVLFDCPPSLGLISTNALAAANKVYIPVQTEYLALESLENLLKKIEMVTSELSLDLEVGGLIATRFDGRKVLNRTVVDTLRGRFGALLLDNMVRENIALAESPRFGKDIFTHHPRSHGAEDYLNLSLEVMGKVAKADSLFTVERGGVITSHGTHAVM